MVKSRSMLPPLRREDAKLAAASSRIGAIIAARNTTVKFTLTLLGAREHGDVFEDRRVDAEHRQVLHDDDAHEDDGEERDVEARLADVPELGGGLAHLQPQRAVRARLHAVAAHVAVAVGVHGPRRLVQGQAAARAEPLAHHRSLQPTFLQFSWLARKATGASSE